MLHAEEIQEHRAHPGAHGQVEGTRRAGCVQRAPRVALILSFSPEGETNCMFSMPKTRVTDLRSPSPRRDKGCGGRDARKQPLWGSSGGAGWRAPSRSFSCGSCGSCVWWLASVGPMSGQGLPRPTRMRSSIVNRKICNSASLIGRYMSLCDRPRRSKTTSADDASISPRSFVMHHASQSERQLPPQIAPRLPSKARPEPLRSGRNQHSRLLDAG